ncbi:MAG: transcriptional repressor general negative regulator of transcription subunit 4 [Caeruleum heppii]|nr:MAG: transcriptional repressor general negative regulator of transcription subunit 4 [Caeruleum heppii]
MNGLCPACRRPYNEKTIEWKVVSPEEFKADVQKQARKKAEVRQKEAQKREAESMNRKHLSGLRVVQKNLVYVVGLNPRIREEDLHQTLRGPQYFGQYGRIVKIVVSKAKDGGQGNQPLGVYVTFAKKEDAEKCIAAVDGSENGGRVLRAQFGTTKYCSAYLRNETCTNKSCMFLHEPGEEKDSFTRQDLSSINVVSTQRPAQPLSPTVGTAAAPQAPNPVPASQSKPPAQQIHPMAAAAQAMARQSSKEGAASPGESADGSALPSSASWANKAGQHQSRRTSQSVSISTSSPMPINAALTNQTRDGASRDQPTRSDDPSASNSGAPSPRHTSSRTMHKSNTDRDNLFAPLFDQLMKAVSSPEFKFVFSSSMFSPEEYEAIMNHPPLLDPNGGAKRRFVREQEKLERQKREEEQSNVSQVVPEGLLEEPPGSGSLQLGGEPEIGPEDADKSGPYDQLDGNAQDRQRNAIRPPSQSASSAFGAPKMDFGKEGITAALSNLSINGRSLTPSQQQHLSVLKGGGSQPPGFADQPQTAPFQNQTPYLGAQGHTRQSSRYTFANDSSSASAAVKPAANAKLMAQQSAMMPTGATSLNHPPTNQQQQAFPQYYGGAAQGPPPGLKPTATPPVSGGAMFGQAHHSSNIMGGSGFNLGGNLSSVDDKADPMREMLRARGTSGSGGNRFDPGKREFMFPSFLSQYPSASSSTAPTPVPGPSASLYTSQPGSLSDTGSHRQRKKGKKHRHANTSSSGGGGIVNLADPSILQARMQQQSGAGSGQGLFSGQGQGGFNSSMMYGGGFGRW